MLDKIKTVHELRRLLAILRAAGEKIVFTNGCFDILHTGHTRYLQKSRSFGDVLVIAVNSDASVRMIKGEKRPINSEAERMEVMEEFPLSTFGKVSKKKLVEMVGAKERRSGTPA